MVARWKQLWHDDWEQRAPTAINRDWITLSYYMINASVVSGTTWKSGATGAQLNRNYSYGM